MEINQGHDSKGENAICFRKREEINMRETHGNRTKSLSYCGLWPWWARQRALQVHQQTNISSSMTRWIDQENIKEYYGRKLVGRKGKRTYGVGISMLRLLPESTRGDRRSRAERKVWDLYRWMEIRKPDSTLYSHCIRSPPLPDLFLE